MTDKAVVIGAGAVGLFTAYELRRRGFEVTLIEREAAVGRGCSAGNMGWVCPSISFPVPSPDLRRKGLRWLLRSDSPLYISPRAVLGMAPWLWRFWAACRADVFERGARALLPLAADAPQRYRRLAADGLALEWHQNGLLILFQSRQGLDAEARLFDTHGYEPVRRLQRHEIPELEPSLAGHEAAFCGALHVLPEGHVRPETVTAAVAARCREVGVEIRTGCRARRLRLQGRVARTLMTAEPPGDNEIEADVFVIATGAECGTLAAACGSRIPMQAGKGYSITVQEPAMRIRHPLYLAESKFGVSPFDEGLRVAGTMELSGVNRRLDRRRIASIRRGAEALLPGILEGSAATEWVGMRPLTPDGLPVMGRLPSTDNVWVNSGHQMLGITLSPVSGHAVAAMIADDGSAPECFHAPAFDPARF